MTKKNPFTLINNEEQDLSFQDFWHQCKAINKYYNPANPKLAVSTPEKVGYNQALEGKPDHKNLLAGYLGVNCRLDLARQAVAIYYVGYHKGSEARKAAQPHLTLLD